MRLLGTMFRELRRRGVVRVAAAYLAVAFVVLQVTDLVVQPLHLPSWTLTLVIILLSAGFVLAVTLAWVFEITPDGLRRQADTSARKPWREGVDPFTAIFIIAAVGAVSIGIAFAWMAVPPAADGPPLDERQIMVMPARTAGADASLSYLGEGLLDLISAKLGDLDVQPIDARSTLAALRGYYRRGRKGRKRADGRDGSAARRRENRGPGIRRACRRAASLGHSAARAR